MTAEKVAQHTPGPWRVTEEICRYSGGEVIRPSRGDGVDSPVAYVADFNRYDRDEERQANARLIAAAPDMLAFLKSIVPGSIYQHEIDGLIAKAEGRS